MSQKIYIENQFEDLRGQLTADCKNCCGLCCTALYFSKSEGFPQDKKAGTPCTYLKTDFRCKIHSQLREKGLKGCTSYDCFGAGQKVTQMLYSNRTWKHMPPDQAEQMFQVFVRICQLHQILWYLIEAISLSAAQKQKNELKGLIIKLQTMTGSDPEEICGFNIDEYRSRANQILKTAGESVGRMIGQDESRDLDKQGFRGTPDYSGKNLSNRDLSGRDFSMSLLLAANLSGCRLSGTNFLGADFRDTDLSSADLSESIFLTQMQINEAKGNRDTQLPGWLKAPEHWKTV